MKRWQVAYYIRIACIGFLVAWGANNGVFTRSFSCAAAEDSIVIYGDPGEPSAVHAQIVLLAASCAPDAVFIAGDLVENPDIPDHWTALLSALAPLQLSAPVYPALGNHERNAPRFYELFQLPRNERWYAVCLDNVEVIVLDSNAPLNADSEQYRWLQNHLAAPERILPFRIVVFHHALLTGGPNGNDEKGIGPFVIPLCKQYGVSMIFNGHNHLYERSVRDGIQYVVTGGGGSGLVEMVRDNPYLQRWKRAHHICHLRGGEEYIVMNALELGGARIDEVRIERNPQ